MLNRMNKLIVLFPNLGSRLVMRMLPRSFVSFSSLWIRRAHITAGVNKKRFVWTERNC